MELFTKYTPNTYIESAYKYLRNSILKSYVYLVLIKTFVYCFIEIRDLQTLFDFLIPFLSIGLFIVILSLESYDVSKKKLLFSISEVINISTYLFGFYIDHSHREIYLISSVVSTCGLQLVGDSKFENILIIIKLVFVWCIIPVLIGELEIPTDQTPYLTAIFIFSVFSTVFTYRKNIEDEYLLAIETIQKMKIQLSKIIQAMPESVLIFSETQEVLLYNLECQKLFQADSSEEIKNKLVTLRYSDDAENSEAVQRSLYDDILMYLDSETDEAITFGINKLNGKSYEWRGAKSEWDEKTIIILTTRDMTSLISYERAKVEAESKTILLRTVSHEIRTPTNTILTLSQSLLEANPDSEHNEKLKIINISSKLLLNLINDLLDFSRMIADCFTINKYEINLRDFIQETYSLFAIQARQKHLDFRFFIDPLLPEIIITDPNRLRQIIINLLSNSLKFTLQGKIRLEALLTEYTTMLIKVTDTGLGISPSKIEHLFDAFNTTQDLKLNPQGCGLGLYISNKFAQMLGTESIQVSSKLHEGSKFSFEVEIGVEKKIRIETTEEELGEACISDERSYETPPRNNFTHDSFTPIQPQILIVDDNEFNLFIMRNFLTSSGYSFNEAKTGIDAVEKVLIANSTGFSIKVVVMDFEMPGMSGPEATKEIFRLYNEKKIAQTPSIIGYSADDSDEKTRICEEAGMKECLSKSCSKNAFLSLIKKYTN